MKFKEVFAVLIIMNIINKIKMQCEPCKCYSKKNLKIADCRFTWLDNIPENIDDDIEVLDFEGQLLQSLEENHFNNFQTLTILNLGSNNIINVNEGCFKKQVVLKNLKLSNNAIEKLPYNIFFDTPKIERIYLDKNKLKILENGLFANLKFLQILQLQGNKIFRIDDNCFLNTRSIIEIDLSSNKIEKLQESIFVPINNLVLLFLHNNPWLCDESTCAFREYALKRNWQITTPYCENPKNVQRRTWKEIKNNVVQIYTEQGENITYICVYKTCVEPKLIWRTNENEIIQTETKRYNDTTYISVLNLNFTGYETDPKIYSCSVENCSECKEARIISKIRNDFSTYTNYNFGLIVLNIILIIILILIVACNSNYFFVYYLCKKFEN